MRLLLLQVSSLPDHTPYPVSALSSLPGLLLENLTTTLQRPVHNLHAALQICEDFRPDLVVFQGDPVCTTHWQYCFERIYPRLFTFASSSQDLFQVLAELNPRLWQLRQKRLKGQQASYQPETPVHPEALFQALPSVLQAQAQQRLKYWLAQHPGLIPFLQQVSTADFERLLYCHALLETALLDWNCPAKVKVLDVGTHVWSYAPALAVSFRARAHALELTGLEIDPWYLQAGFTRADLARYYAGICQARFLPLDFLQFQENQDFICHFLPLILPQNALLWRLPPEYHHPLALLKHSWHQLRPGGRCLIYVGKAIEYQALLRTLEQAGLTPVLSRPWFCPWRQSYHGFLTLLQCSA